jgi:tetraacyldisaccharide-1-P 4'-kinase
LINLKDFHAKAQSPPSATDHRPPTTDHYLAFCALGNPNNFFEQLRREGFNLIAAQTFSDHHFYNQSDIEKLVGQAKRSGAEILLTTAKDAVKLKNLRIDLPCLVVESELMFDGEDDFRKLILANIKIK